MDLLKKRFLLIFIFSLISFIIAISLNQFRGYPFQMMFDDIAAARGKYTGILTGLFSNIGLFILSATAGISFITLKLTKKKQFLIDRFFSFSFYFTLILLLDDAYLLHEKVLPDRGIPEIVIFILYFLFGLYGLIINYEFISNSSWKILLLANLFFLVSFFCDLKLNDLIDYDLLIFIEDFAKLTGIFSWLIYIYDSSILSLKTKDSNN